MRVVLQKLNKPSALVEDDEETMFDLIDDFCLVADKSAKRVSFFSNQPKSTFFRPFSPYRSKMPLH